MLNKKDSGLNNLLALLSPAVPGSSNTSKEEPRTYHRYYPPFALVEGNGSH